jgi:putative addiction module antidote
MTMLKLVRIGNSVGVVLPKELLAKLGTGEGDTICATVQSDGIRLTSADPKFLSRLLVTHRVAQVRRAVLMDLAK